MKTKENLREFTRVTIAVEAEVRFAKEGEATVVTGRTKDLSMKGIFILSEEKLPVGSKCLVSLTPIREPKHFRIEANGRVVRLGEAGMGIEFVEIFGLESYDHLRNVVLYNSSHEIEQVEEELKQHLGLKRRV